VEDDTTRGMGSSLYPYIGRNPNELVYRPGDAWRHYIMDMITIEFCIHLLIEYENSNIDSSLKMIWGMLFIDEIEVEIITKYQQ